VRRGDTHSDIRDFPDTPFWGRPMHTAFKAEPRTGLIDCARAAEPCIKKTLPQPLLDTPMPVADRVREHETGRIQDVQLA